MGLLVVVIINVVFGEIPGPREGGVDFDACRRDAVGFCFFYRNGSGEGEGESVEFDGGLRLRVMFFFYIFCFSDLLVSWRVYLLKESDIKLMGKAAKRY